MPPTALLETLQAIGRKVRLYGVALGAGRVIAAVHTLILSKRRRSDRWSQKGRSGCTCCSMVDRAR